MNCAYHGLNSSALSEIKPMDGLISKTFKNLYYTEPENRWLDGCADKIFSSTLSNQHKAVYLYTLFQACLQKRPFNLFHRSNLNLRLNRKVKRNFGNYTTWQRSFPELMLRSYDELSAARCGQGEATTTILERHQMLLRYRDMGSISYTLIRPISAESIGTTRDDYWQEYHFLRGFVPISSSWSENDRRGIESKVHAPPRQHCAAGTKGGRLRSRCTPLMRKHRKSIVVLSYVSDAVPTRSITSQSSFAAYSGRFSVHSKEHTHALAKNKKRELLFVGRP